MKKKVWLVKKNAVIYQKNTIFQSNEQILINTHFFAKTNNAPEDLYLKLFKTWSDHPILALDTYILIYRYK